MENLVEVLKPVLKAVGSIVVFFLLFWYGGGFSERQSLVLATALCALYWLLNSFTSNIARFLRREQQFQPYWVLVEPRWYELLRDRNLVRDTTEWGEIQQRVKDLPNSQYNVLRDGIAFIVLKPGVGYSYPGLVYRNNPNKKYFATEIDFCESVREFLKQPETWRGSYFSPEVFIKWGPSGYDLGITLNIVDGRWPERDTLAVLPDVEFEHYHTPWEDVPLREKGARVDKLENRRKSGLNQRGWKIRTDLEADAELGHLRYCVEHKYFIVSHDAL